ncbi:MAG: NACHT domain-containing protein [Thermoleophilia bacterium]
MVDLPRGPPGGDTGLVTSAIPDIDFRRIRPYGQPASRSSAFEELASILIQQGIVDWPQGVRFVRFGNPDGGREGKAVLPSGDVWAWQAKYLFEFNSSAAGQVTASVRRALSQEPRLKRYFVVLPLDMPAGDTDGQTSAYTRWNDKVSEWEAMAREQGLEVEFTFLGAHQLLTALTEPQHAGRARYWFGADVLTSEWQARRLEEAIAKAGHRYTPRLHVEVETIQALNALGRVDAYVARWQRVLAGLREARRWPWRAPAEAADAYAEALSASEAALDDADAALVLIIAAARSTDALPQVEDVLDVAAQTVLRVDDLLHRLSLTEGGYFVSEAASLYSRVRQTVGALNQGGRLARAATTQAARYKVLVLTGRAGVGKTHLFCDVAAGRLLQGCPTILLLGQDFDGRSLLSQIGELSQLRGSAEDVLSVLDSAAEAAGCIGLLMIDALNESERPERWRDDVRALVAMAARWPHVALVVSCRTEFVEAVIGDEPVAMVEHVGFAEATDVAVQRFTREFGLEAPTFPVLSPEFSNPLFLKLTCEALATLGVTRFPFGAAGLATVCDAFLEAVNKRLAEPTRCDYDERSDPVRGAVREIALLGDYAADRADVERITNDALPDRPWSRSLMRGLIAEGVLLERSDGRIAFGYQRLGDVMRATAIAEQSSAEVQAWLAGLGRDIWRERGVLGALAVIVPESHGIELLDLAVDDKGVVPPEIVDSFLESLLLRSPDSTTPRAVEIVERLLDRNYRADEVWDRLIRIACVPGHRLNAEWLHARLADYGVSERDRSWSMWLVGAVDADEESAVRRLIEWAWPASLQDRSSVPDDVAVLATLLLGWLLTTSDRRVRDHATKAIVSVAERAPGALAETLGRFHGTNDPYVVERLAAAACGVVLRMSDAAAAQRIAEGVSELIKDDWPSHLLTRDYVRRVFEEARTGGWSGDSLRPHRSEWPVATRPVEEIEALAGPPDYAYGSIWHSLTGWGDFGHYVLERALRHFESQDEEALQHDAERAVFERVLELGWTPERFREFDRGRHGGHDGVVERVGKKYQWIGYYEVLGRIADHHAIKPWGEGESRPYAYAEQLVWRDIDPTVLARKPAAPPAPEPRWFSPVAARFVQDVVDEYPDDMSGVPDPLDLIAVSDASGTQWLVLVSNPKWEQPLAPEIGALRTPQLAVWTQLHAYLVPQRDAAALREWARDKDWFGRWMPDTPEVHSVLLGGHPDDPGWSAADGRVDWWSAAAGSRPPVELLQCAAWYGGTGSSLDASANEETSGYVPTRRLIQSVGLSRGVDFAWNDASGVAVCDPSVVAGGPATLVMRRDLLPRLEEAGLTVFWTVLIGNELHNNDITSPRDGYRWVSASASYIVAGDRVERAGARAVRCRPGPTVEREVRWDTRTAED